MGGACGPGRGGSGGSLQTERGERQLPGAEGGFGASDAPGSQGRAGTIGVRVAVALLDGYKRWISPLLPRACRFSPSCSQYARLAVLKHGVAKGSALAAWRVLRCNPFHPGGVDLP